jgi:hypothetical protein
MYHPLWLGLKGSSDAYRALPGEGGQPQNLQQEPILTLKTNNWGLEPLSRLVSKTKQVTKCVNENQSFEISERLDPNCHF